MQAYITLDASGEYLWLVTPYKDFKTKLWQAKHESPDNKIPLKSGTLEMYSWEAVNDPFPINIHKLKPTEVKKVKQYAIT